MLFCFYFKIQHFNMLSQHFEYIVSTYVLYYFNNYSKNVELVYPKCRINLFIMLNQLKKSVEALKMVLQELE